MQSRGSGEIKSKILTRSVISQGLHKTNFVARLPEGGTTEGNSRLQHSAVKKRPKSETLNPFTIFSIFAPCWRTFEMCAQTA
jgi:hypothetical protein